MTVLTLVAAWCFVYLAAAFDAAFALYHRETFQEWELNPAARHLGLPGILVVKVVGLLFCLGLVYYCRARHPGHARFLTVANVAVHGGMLAAYLL